MIDDPEAIMDFEFMLEHIAKKWKLSKGQVMWLVQNKWFEMMHEMMHQARDSKD